MTAALPLRGRAGRGPGRRPRSGWPGCGRGVRRAGLQPSFRPSGRLPARPLSVLRPWRWMFRLARSIVELTSDHLPAYLPDSRLLARLFGSIFMRLVRNHLGKWHAADRKETTRSRLRNSPLESPSGFVRTRSRESRRTPESERLNCSGSRDRRQMGLWPATDRERSRLRSRHRRIPSISCSRAEHDGAASRWSSPGSPELLGGARRCGVHGFARDEPGAPVAKSVARIRGSNGVSCGRCS